jgi:hypothetical protein
MKGDFMWNEIVEILEVADMEARSFAEDRTACGDTETYEILYKDELRKHLIEIRDMMAKAASKKWDAECLNFREEYIDEK